MTATELFSCSGGMAEGFRRAGITFDHVFDADPDACDSYAANHGHRPTQMDVRDLLAELRAGRSLGAVDLLVADPPCTPWSRAGKRQGLDDERDMLLVTVEIIRLVRPRTYLIGNVPGLEDADNWRAAVQPLIGGLGRDGYCVAEYAILDAADYGGVLLCNEHAQFAGRLSKPSHVMGCAAITGSAALKQAHLARTAPGHCTSRHEETCADDARQNAKASSTVCTPSEANVVTGRVVGTKRAVGDTSGDGLGLACPGCVSTGLSRSRSSDASSTTGRSSTMWTGTKRITLQATLKSTKARLHTSDIIAAEMSVGACGQCQWYATPQHRRRPWWFGHLDGPCLRWPEPTHGDWSTMRLDGRQPWVTCREALAVLPPEEWGRPCRLRYRGSRTTSERQRRKAGTKARASRIGEPAETIRAKASSDLDLRDRHPASVMDAPSYVIREPDRNRPPSPLNRPSRTVTGVADQHMLSWPWDRPATTVQRDARIAPPGHHNEWSIMSMPDAVVLSEAAAAILQGFPLGWKFCGKTKRSRWSQIGQAMPPALAEAVARVIVERATDQNRGDQCA